MLCAQFGCMKVAKWFLRKILDIVNVFSQFHPLYTRILSANFGWNWPHDSKLQKMIFKFCQCIFTFLLLSPLETGRVLHLNKLEFPSPNMFCAKFGWNWPRALEEVDKNVKFYNDNDDSLSGQIVIRKADLSLRRGWAKNTLHPAFILKPYKQ